MTALRWALAILAFLFIAAAWVRLQADGVLLIGTVLFVAWLWSCGALSRDFWVADDATSARLAAVDEELRFTESVKADLELLDRAGDRKDGAA